MTAEQLRDIALEVLNGRIEIDFKEELTCLFSAAKQGKLYYIFHNADFSCEPDQFYEYLMRSGFTLRVRKPYGYDFACSLTEIINADDVKVSWK